MEAKDLYMVSYWVEEKGLTEALEEYFPTLVEEEPLLAHALAQYKVAELGLRATIEHVVDRRLGEVPEE